MTSELQKIIDIARRVGDVIMPYHGNQEKLAPEAKADNTPLTLADLAAHDVVMHGLNEFSTLPILSEEGRHLSFAERSEWDRYWLVDPIDGTRAFIRAEEDFTVNIALVEGHKAILGVIYAPIPNVCYYAVEGYGAFRQTANELPERITTRAIDWDHLDVAIGFYHDVSKLEAILTQYVGHTLARVNSSLKLGMVASGEVDLYPRVGPTSEWDTAAGQCILSEAGGVVVDLQGKSLQYNAEESLRNPAFLALGDPSQLEKVLSIFESERGVYREQNR